MASPIGHALAGIAVAWGADLVAGDRRWRLAPRTASWFTRAGDGLTLTCAVLAAAPDLDLPFGRFHRTATHSLLSVGIIAALAFVVARRLRLPPRRVAIMCAAAWGTHLLLDWLSSDQSIPQGIQLLWPFGDGWFISGWDIFSGSERRELFSAPTMKRNLQAIAQEIAILAPVVVVLWSVRVKALARLASQLAGGDHPPK